MALKETQTKVTIKETQTNMTPKETQIKTPEVRGFEVRQRGVTKGKIASPISMFETRKSCHKRRKMIHNLHG